MFPEKKNVSPPTPRHHASKFPYPPPGLAFLAPAAPAVFTVVREPLERFLSGYGQCGNQTPVR